MGTQLNLEALMNRRATEHSQAAGESIRPSAGTLRALVLTHVMVCGPCTDEEIAEALSMNPSTARPRRLELQRQGLIRECGEKPTRSGRLASLWEAVPVAQDFRGRNPA